MKCYLAPLEGITTYIYRNAYHTCFHPMDKYFTPFFVPHQKKGFAQKEINELLPEHNEGMHVVPQIMTNQAADFLHTAGKMQQFGYKEVNLNLGCPSKTVVSKNKGSGFLAFPEELDRFLDQIFSDTTMKISVKTRLGKNDPEEFFQLMEIYNKYPLEELIIHPRIQTDYYKNRPRLDIYEETAPKSLNPVCYNGDLFSFADYERLLNQFPYTSTIMLGRGILQNPGLAGEIKYGEQADKKRIRIFHDKIYNDYQELYHDDKSVLFKMKELWSYEKELFADSAKYAKKIRKAEKASDYLNAVNALFQDLDLKI